MPYLTPEQLKEKYGKPPFLPQWCERLLPKSFWGRESSVAAIYSLLFLLVVLLCLQLPDSNFGITIGVIFIAPFVWIFIVLQARLTTIIYANLRDK